MELFVMIWLVALVASVVTAFGNAWGPAVLGVGLAGWGLLLLLSGLRGPIPAFGILYVCAGFAEFAATWKFMQPASARGPSVSWRAGAALVGVAGTIGSVILLVLIAQAVISALII